MDEVKQGARVHMSIRPERLFLSEHPTESESLKGTIVENIFIGTDITTIIDLAEGPNFTVRTSNSDRGTKRIFEPGAQAYVNMEHGAARLLVD